MSCFLKSSESIAWVELSGHIFLSKLMTIQFYGFSIVQPYIIMPKLCLKLQLQLSFQVHNPVGHGSGGKGGCSHGGRGGRVGRGGSGSSELGRVDVMFEGKMIV